MTASDPLFDETSSNLRSRFTLRLVDRDDADALVDYYLRTRETHAEWNPIPPEGFFTAAFHRERLAAYEERSGRGEEFRFVLLPADDPEMIIGSINLTAIERGVFQNGRFGYSLDAAWWGQGIASGALRQVITFAFDDVGLHRLEANIMPRNDRSRRVLEKCGFQRVGYSPRMIRINGLWEDHEMWALLVDQFNALS